MLLLRKLYGILFLRELYGMLLLRKLYGILFYSDRTNKPYINTDSISSVNFAIPVGIASL